MPGRTRSQGPEKAFNVLAVKFGRAPLLCRPAQPCTGMRTDTIEEGMELDDPAYLRSYS